MSIKGFKSQQALQQKLSGFTESQSLDQARYVTVQEMPGRRHALDVTISGLYKISASPLTVSAGNIRTIICASHGASANDMIRLSDGTTVGVLSVPDVNTIITAVELSVSPVGDTFTVWRAITPAYNSDGSLNVSVTPSPITYNRKSGGTTIATTVLEDLDTPANSRAMPVVLHGVDAASITITSGDLNISSSHVNDSIAIGDGTNLVAVTAANELKVSNPVLNVDTASSGTITGTSSVQIATTNCGSVSFTVAGTWTGTITVELSQDNSTWYTTSYVALASGNTASSFTANTSGQINVVGYAYCRLKGATVATGTAVISLIASNKVATINMDHPLAAGSNNIGSIRDITGTITLPTLASTSTLQTAGNSSLSSIDGKLTSVATSTLQTTGNTSLATIATNTTSIATSALQTTGNSSLSSIDAKIPVLGQALAAASVPMVLTAAQLITLTPPAAITGFSTESTLSTINTKVPALGQALAAASTPVVLTAVQLTTLTPPAAITGFNLETTQTAMSAKLPASLGIKTAALSLSVTPASDAIYSTKPRALTGSFAELLTLTTVQTFTAPANAVGALIQASDANTANIRIKQGATATATSGIQMQPGRSESLTNGTDISVCSESGTNAISVIWSIQA